MPALGKVSQQSYRIKIYSQATVTVLALLRYGQDKGSYPQDLQELIAAGYLKEMPIDPFSGKPLIYRKEADGFILYSVGEDFEDNGGQLYRDDKGKVKVWGKEGDAIFWPVDK
jgi:hypothetical protein